MSVPTNTFANLLALVGILPSSSFFELRMENDVNGNILYLGRTTIPNAPTSSAVWEITKFEYDNNGFMNRSQLADDGSKLTYIWDNRATYFS